MTTWDCPNSSSTSSANFFFSSLVWRRKEKRTFHVSGIFSEEEKSFRSCNSGGHARARSWNKKEGSMAQIFSPEPFHFQPVSHNSSQFNSPDIEGGKQRLIAQAEKVVHNLEVPYRAYSCTGKAKERSLYGLGLNCREQEGVLYAQPIRHLSAEIDMYV